MSKESTLIFLGIVIALISFVGVPLFWRSIILPIIGVSIVLIGVSLRSKKQRQSETEVPAPTAPVPPQNF